MNPLSISSILVVCTVFPLGFFVYIQNHKKWANRIWLVYSFALTVWGICATLISNTTDPSKALLYWRITMGLGVIWMPVLFYHFAYLYAPFDEKRKLITAYVITTILAISAFTPFYIPSVVWKFGSIFYATPGIAFHILTAWWFILTGYSHTKLYKDSKNMTKERQNQIKYFIFASSIAYLGGLHNFSVVYGFPIYPWGNFIIILYPFIMTYAMVKHGLFDIFLFIKRIFYTSGFIFLIAWSIGSLSIANQYLKDQYGLPFWTLPILAGFLAVYIVYLFLANSREAEKVKNEFITVAAHKLRTPLTHIGYIADELKDAKSESEIERLSVSLKEANDRLVDLINKLLDVTNLEAQSTSDQSDAVDIKKVTDIMLEEGLKMAEHKNIKVNIKADENIFKVEAYEKSLTFVIQSMFENAIFYTPNNGQIDIEITGDKKFVYWSIKDSGIGIAKKDLDKVFDKFFRTSEAIQEQTEGTGLALFMSRNIIKRQGGVLKVESDGLGKGTRFYFSLPVYKE